MTLIEREKKRQRRQQEKEKKEERKRQKKLDRRNRELLRRVDVRREFEVINEKYLGLEGKIDFWEREVTSGGIGYDEVEVVHRVAFFELEWEAGENTWRILVKAISGSYLKIEAGRGTTIKDLGEREFRGWHVLEEESIYPSQRGWVKEFPRRLAFVFLHMEKHIEEISAENSSV